MPAILKPTDFHTEYRYVNGLKMHMAVEGDVGAPLIVLLHGAPEFWYSWRHQIKALASAGYRVVAPDQRGYNLTDKVGPYDIFTLSDDIAGLLDKMGVRRAEAIIGHDWGGVVAWTFGARYPQLLEKLIVCNVPHPKTAQETLQRMYLPQILKSWYVYFFQLPNLPERWMTQDDFKVPVSQLRAVPDITDEEIGYFVEAWSQPGAMTGAINWYRALFSEAQRINRAELQVHVPSLLLWGEDDAYLSKETAEWTRKYVDDLTIQYLPGVSHWTQQHAPDEVNRAIFKFIRGRA